MRKIIALLPAAALLLSAAGCQKALNHSPDDGEVTGQVYTNRFFGFSMSIPQGWSVAPAPPKPPEGSTNAAATDTHQLLLVSEKPLDLRGVSNPTLLVVVEKASVSGAHTGKEYLDRVTRLLAESIIEQDGKAIPYAKAGEVREWKVGGKPFYRADLTARVSDKTARQSYFSTVLDGYTFSIVVAAVSEAEIKRLEEIVNTASFH